MSVPRLQALLQTGMHLNARIESIESLLGQLAAKVESREVPERHNPVSSQDFYRRIEQAIEAADLGASPGFCLGARPVNETAMPTLFRSRQAEVVQLLENPPRLRTGGFDLEIGGQAQMVRSMLRRVVKPGFKLLELWRDGSLIFVAQGNEHFLCWPPTRDDQTKDPLVINAIPLVETAYLFVDLCKKIYSFAEPGPTGVEFVCELRKLTRQQPSQLAVPSDYDRFLRSVGSPAPSAGNRWTREVDLAATEPGKIAFGIVAAVFEWYSAEHERIPYQSEPGIIDPALIAKI